MLLAVGVISAGVFILSPRHWEQVQSLLALQGHSARGVYLYQHCKWQEGGDTSVFLAGSMWVCVRAEGSSVCWHW